MAVKLRHLMEDDGLRSRMGQAALKASDRFDETLIMEKWVRLFNGLL